jgi:uncharacterized peroxidase-related enzyme
VVSDYRTAPLAQSESALLGFAVKLTREPSSCARDDVEALRRLGWSDRAILDATQVVSYFGFVNRIAHGLGVELEEGFGRSGEAARC